MELSFLVGGAVLLALLLTVSIVAALTIDRRNKELRDADWEDQNDEFNYPSTSTRS